MWSRTAASSLIALSSAPFVLPVDQLQRRYRLNFTLDLQRFSAILQD
jgi:hypothetical protein